MPIDVDTIEEELSELFTSIAEIPFIIGNQNGVKLNGQYGTLYITDLGAQGRWDGNVYENNSSDPDVTETIVGTRTLLVSVNVIRNNARSVLSKIDSGIHRTSSIQKLTELNLGLQSKSSIRDVSIDVEANREQRAQMDIFINATSVDSESVTSIESMTIDVTYETPNKQINTQIEANDQ